MININTKIAAFFAASIFVFLFVNFSRVERVILIFSLFLLAISLKYYFLFEKEEGIIKIKGYVLRDKGYNFEVISTKVYGERNYTYFIRYNIPKYRFYFLKEGDKVITVVSKEEKGFEVKRVYKVGENKVIKLREKFRDRIERNYKGREREILFSSLFGGGNKYKEILKKSGILHLFAVSGFHVFIVYSFFMMFFRFLLLPRNMRYILIIPLLITYSLLAGLSPSSVRASMFLSLRALYKIIGFEESNLNIIGSVGIINILLTPFDVFNPAFQMSYAATVGIILFINKEIKNTYLISFAAFVGASIFQIIHFSSFSFGGLIFTPIASLFLFFLIFLSFWLLLFSIPFGISNIIDILIKSFFNFFKIIDSKLYFEIQNLRMKILVLLLLMFIYAITLQILNYLKRKEFGI